MLALPAAKSACDAAHLLMVLYSTEKKGLDLNGKSVLNNDRFGGYF